jgi:predicted transcriptional regulator
VQCSAVQCSAVQCSAVQSSAVQCKLSPRTANGSTWVAEREESVYGVHRPLHLYQPAVSMDQLHQEHLLQHQVQHQHQHQEHQHQEHLQHQQEDQFMQEPAVA